MTRFINFEPVTLKRDLDADETGYTPAGVVTVAVDGTAPVTASQIGSSSVYAASLGVRSAPWHSRIRIEK